MLVLYNPVKKQNQVLKHNLKPTYICGQPKSITFNLLEKYIICK